MGREEKQASGGNRRNRRTGACTDVRRKSVLFLQGTAGWRTVPAAVRVTDALAALDCAWAHGYGDVVQLLREAWK
jgi:hypothetical protein